MTIRRTAALAAQRRSGTARGAAASGPERSSTGSGLEATVPGEVIALYSAVIAGCESAAGASSYFAFRVGVYIVGVLATAITAGRAVQLVVGNLRHTLGSAEVQTAVLSFAAWGLVLPGSFLYVCLHKPALSLVVVTVTATAAFVLGVFYGPQLKQHAGTSPSAPTGPPLTRTPPA